MKTPAAALIACLLGLAILMPVLAVEPVSAADTRKVVTIGYAGPMSGDAASLGLSMAQAVELALSEANARNPHVGGKPVVFKLLAQDDRGETRTAALVADYLVKAGAVAVVGHWQSIASLSGAPIYHAAGIPQISPGSSNRQLTANGYSNIFRVVGHDDDIGQRVAQYALQTLHAKRIAIINDDTVYGTLLANLFAKNLSQDPSLMVARHVVSSKTSDFNAALEDLKIQKPDLVFFGGQVAQAAALQLNLKRTGINAKLIAAGGVVSPIYPKLTGAAGEGTLGVATGLPQEKMNGWKKFQEKFIAAYGDHIDYYAPFAYDATNVILAAIKQADSLLPAQLNNALHNIKYQGLTGLISFDAHGNLNNPTYTIFQLRGGKWLPEQSFGSK